MRCAPHASGQGCCRRWREGAGQLARDRAGSEAEREGFFFFFNAVRARSQSDRLGSGRRHAHGRERCPSGCGNLIRVVCLVASPVVGLLSEARGHPPGVNIAIARHVPVKRLKTALKKNKKKLRADFIKKNTIKWVV